MLVEFAVENFRSFKDKATLSMLATSDRSNPGNTSSAKPLKDEALLNSAVIFGPNASGKSNIILAMAQLRSFVLLSHLHQKGNRLNYQPFAFSAEEGKKPTKFDVVFIHADVRYHYTLSYDAEKIVKEELIHYPNGKPALIFSRNGQEYEFKKDATEQRVISKRTLENALYLSASVQFNYEGTAAAYDWFLREFIVLDTSDVQDLIEKAIEGMNHDRKMKDSVLRALQIADLGIVGVEGKVRKIPVHELRGKVPPQILGVMMMTSGGEAKQTDLKFKHRISDSKGEHEIGLSYDLESEGTRRLFAIIGPVIEVLHSGGTLVIDELDTKLHHEISSWLISLFHDPEQNRKGAQLIFNTHDQQMLSFERFRRDQIWFTQKDPDGGFTTLYSLAEFGERKDRDVLKAYQLGRYGAVPFIAPDKVV